MIFANFLYMITIKVDGECIELFFNTIFTDFYSIVYLVSNTIINYLWSAIKKQKKHIFSKYILQ